MAKCLFCNQKRHLHFGRAFPWTGRYSWRHTSTAASPPPPAMSRDSYPSPAPSGRMLPPQNIEAEQAVLGTILSGMAVYLPLHVGLGW